MTDPEVGKGGPAEKIERLSEGVQEEKPRMWHINHDSCNQVHVRLHLILITQGRGHGFVFFSLSIPGASAVAAVNQTPSSKQSGAEQQEDESWTYFPTPVGGEGMEVKQLDGALPTQKLQEGHLCCWGRTC